MSMPKTSKTTRGSIAKAPTAKQTQKAKGSIAKPPNAPSSTSTKPAKSTHLYSSFLPIPLSFTSPLPLPSSSSHKQLKSTTHYIYARAHTSKSATPGHGASEDLPSDRTVFVANVPVDMTERGLRSVFARWGVVESVVFGGGRGGDVLERAVRGITPESDDEEDDGEDGEEGADKGEKGDEDPLDPLDPHAGAKFIGDASAPRKQRRRLNKLPSSVPTVIDLPSLDPRTEVYRQSGISSAHVIYVDSISIAQCLSSSSTPIPIPSTPSSTTPTGLQYYLHLHSTLRPPLPSIRQHADTSMARFDHLSSLLLAARARQQGAGALVDEDGFTVVVRSGRNGRTGGFGDGTWKGTTSVGVASRGFAKGVKEQGKGGKGGKELVDFYKFQKTERKRQELADLRNRFEKDKLKVAAMRKTNRFKPY